MFSLWAPRGFSAHKFCICRCSNLCSIGCLSVVNIVSVSLVIESSHTSQQLNEKRSVKDSAAVFNEPHLGLLLGDTLELADTTVLCLPAANTLASTAEDYVEVHTENTG